MSLPAPLPSSSSRIVAIVTGGGSGLGRALATALAERGAHVLVADIDAARGTAVAASLRGRGLSAEFASCDVTSAEDVEALVTATLAEHGRLDWMINNAGVGVLGEARDMEPGHWQRVMDVNVMGVVHGVQSAYPRMVAQGSGRIVNMASIAGLIPTPTGVAYSASKHAVVALSLALRWEAAALGVSVTVACPGFVRTGFGDAAQYLRVDRSKLFAPAQEDIGEQERIAGRILRGAERHRAVVLTPAWVRLLWWSWRASPWAYEHLIAPVVMRRHRRVRTP